jgi:YhcH/YjgK/YiaL family protein
VIVDRLGNRAVDAYVPPRVRQALEYLRTHDMARVPLGRHEIDGGRLVALVQEYTTRPVRECAWEAHRKYIDVQLVVSGRERMGHGPRASLAVLQPYDADRDVALFEPGAAFVTIVPGSYAIFGPEDVHAPGGAVDDAPAPVRKVVMKAAIEAV